MSSHSQPGARAPEKPRGSIGMEWYDLSPERQIKWLLGSNKNAKWGWVIYRCCYKPELDTTWDIFKRLLHKESYDSIAESDAPEIANNLDWLIVEDPALEGLSHNELKPRFRDWVRAEADYNVDGPEGSRHSRHEYFVQVDEAALLSFLDHRGVRANPTHVNLVRAWADPLPEEEATDELGDEVDGEDCMRIEATMVAPYFMSSWKTMKVGTRFTRRRTACVNGSSLFRYIS